MGDHVYDNDTHHDDSHHDGHEGGHHGPYGFHGSHGYTIQVKAPVNM